MDAKFRAHILDCSRRYIAIVQNSNIETDGSKIYIYIFQIMYYVFDCSRANISNHCFNASPRTSGSDCMSFNTM